MEEFLKQCEDSGDSTYSALKDLLLKLNDPTTRTQARIFLSHLQKRFNSSKESLDQCFHNFHFRIHDIPLPDYQGAVKEAIETLRSNNFNAFLLDLRDER